MAKTHSSKYLANVLNSIKYATIDSVAELNPVIVTTFKNNKGFFRDTIDELKEGAEGQEKFDFKGLAKETLANAKEDIKTGNLYNKQRMKATQDDAVMKMLGINMDDLFGDDEYDEDAYEEYDTDDENIQSEGSNGSFQDPLVLKATQMSVAGIGSSVAASNSVMTNTLGSVMIKTSDINTKAIGGASAQVLAGLNTSTAMMHKDLAAMNQNIAGIVTFTNEALRTHIENSTSFYDTMTTYAQTQTALMQEMVDMQKQMMPKNNNIKDKVSIRDIFDSDGVIDLRTYKDYLKENNFNGGGIMGLINESMPVLSSFIKGSPTGELMKMGIKKAIPQTLKTIFSDANDMVTGIAGTALINLTQARTGRNGDFFKKLGEMFGLKVPDVTKMNTGNYDKGPSLWTGKDHKALTVVIPKYLSDIYAAVSGGDGTRYDYEKGKFVRNSDILKQFDQQRQNAVSSANSDINSEIAKQLNKIQFSNADEKKQIMDAIEKIQEYNFKEMRNFNPNSTVAADLDPKTYGITGPNAESIMQIVKMLYSTIDKKVQMKGSVELLESVSKYNETLREQEAAGDHLFTALFDDSLEESKIIDTPIMASAKRLDRTNFILDNILDVVSEGNRIATISYEQQIGATTASAEKETTKKEYTTSKKKSKDTFSIGDDLSTLEKMLANGEVIDESEVEDKRSYTTRIKDAEHASDKLKEFFKGFSLLANKPLTFMKGAIDKVDEYAYSLFFGNGQEDVKSISGKIMKGFDNVFNTITSKVSGIFTAVADEVKEQGKATANGIFKALFGIDFKKFKDDLKEGLFGDKDESFFSGMGKLFKTGMGEIFGDFFSPVKSFFNKDKDIPSAAKGMEVTKTGLVAVSAGERIIPGPMDPASIGGRKNAEKTAIDKFKNKFGLGSVDIDGYAEGGYIPDPNTDKRYKSNMTYEQFNAFYQTLTSEEEKSYYFNKFTKDYSKRLAKKAFSNAKDTPKNIQDRVRKVSDKIRKENPVMADAIDREVQKVTESKFTQTIRSGTRSAMNGAYEYGKSMKDRAKEGYNWVKSELDNNDEFTAAFKDLMGKFAPNGGKEVIDDIAKNWKSYLPKTITGGALGAGVSLLTGLAGGPLLGAAVGSALAFTSKSKALQKMIFGEDIVDDKGNVIERKDGIFKRDISDAIQKYAPDMTKGGITGMALSMLPIIPGSPLMGLMVGGALGYAKNNEEIMEVLSGTREKLNNAKDIVKKKLPSMGLGALAGALTGPFGLTTNLLVGSAIGFASDTERFKQMIFGYKGLDGKRAGGLVGVFKKLLAPPIQALNKLIDASTKFFSEEVFNPLRKAIKPMFQQVENFFNKIGDVITDSISTHITKPIGNYITDKLLVPIEKRFLKILTAPVKLARRGIRTAISPFVRVGRGLERRQLKNIGYAGGTAADRIARREEYINDFEDESSRVFDPLSRIPGIGQFLARTPLTRTGRRAHNAEKWREDFRNSESAKFDEYMTSGISTEEKARLKLLNEALGSSIFSGDKGVEKYAKSILVSTSLSDVLNNLAVRNKIPYSYIKTITKELTKGECAISVKLIRYNSPELTLEEKTELIKRIKDVANQVQEGIELAENANEEADRFEREHGFSIRGRAVGRALDKEIKADQEMTKDDVEAQRRAILGMPPEEKAEEREEQQFNYIHGIFDDVHIIAEAFRQSESARLGAAAGTAWDTNMDNDNIREMADNPTAPFALPSSGDIYPPKWDWDWDYADEKEEKQSDEQYQYTENGIVHLIRNDRDELEVDEQDSDTRETIRRRDDEQTTQKGILGKLSGIGTSLLDFFTGKNEEKKPSIFSKILSMLGIGFSFLGGSKFLSIAKLVAGGALLSFGIGKLTKTDENGESIASKIGDKVGVVFGGVMDKVGGWWNNTAKPWILEDFIPTAIEGLGTGLKAAVGAGGWLAESLGTLLVDIAPDVVAGMITGIAKAVWNGIKGIITGGEEKPTTEDIEGNNRGYRSNETKESINLQTTTTVAKNTVNRQYKTQKNMDGTTSNVRDVESEIKNSNAYRNIKSNKKKNEIASNDSLQQMWDQGTFIQDANGNQYTLGELANTSGVYLMDDTNGNPIYSDDLFTQTAVLKKVINNSNFDTELSGEYGSVSDEERDLNSGTTASDHYNILARSVDAVIRKLILGDAYGLGLVNSVTKGRGKVGIGASKLFSKMGTVGKYASVLNSTRNIGNAIPAAALNFTDEFGSVMKNGGTFIDAIKAGGKGAVDIIPFSDKFKKIGSKLLSSESKFGKVVNATKKFTGKIKDTGIEKLMDITKITKDIDSAGDMAEDFITQGAKYKSDTTIGKVLIKIKEYLDKVFSDKGLIEKIYKKANKGADLLDKAKKITRDKIATILKEAAERLASMLPGMIGDKVKDLGAKIAADLSTGGFTRIASVATGFLTGFKNADAYFEVGFGDVSLIERLASGLLGVVQEVAYGLIDPHKLIQWGLWAIGMLGFNTKDIEERQQKLQEVVNQYNDEYGTNYTPYDFIMDDKIETKIMKFFGKIAKTIGSGALTILKGAKTVVWDGAAKGVVAIGKTLFTGDTTNITSWKENLNENFAGVIEQAKKTGSYLTQHNPSTKAYYENYMNNTGITSSAYETAAGTEAYINSYNEEDTINTAMGVSSGLTAYNGDSLVEASQYQLAGSLAQISGCTTEELYANKDRSTLGEGYSVVNSINSGWNSLNSSFTPLLDIMNNNGDKIADMVSKNIAVAMGLADADEDVTLEDILTDNKYASIRAKVIQDNSLIAAITGGVTGSNSNSITAQDSAARKKLYSTQTITATQKKINRLKANYGIGIVAGEANIGAFGSGLRDEKETTDINPNITNFISQRSSKIANKKIGNGEITHTVSEAGCAPTSAMMAINSNIDTESTIGINEAIKTAGGYLGTNGGVTADYFADEFARHGFKTAYVPKKDKNQKKILMHQLGNGISVVMMGKDNSNTSKKDSPFGPTYHYVVATGLSEDGNYVYINDPEASVPNMKYPVDTIFNNSDLSIVPIKAVGRIGSLPTKVKMGLSGYSGAAVNPPKILYIGDSRMQGMKSAYPNSSVISFIVDKKADYDWLIKKKNVIKNTAKNYSDSKIIMNVGLYDLGNVSKIVAFCKSTFLADSNFKDRVYFMSINPVDDKKCKNADITNAKIKTFNNAYKVMAQNKYIDINAAMDINGYKTSSDGINYTSDQYKKIHNYVLDFFNGKLRTTKETTATGPVTSVVGTVGNAVANGTTEDLYNMYDDSAYTAGTGSTRKIKTIGDLISAIGSLLTGAYGLSSSDESDSLTGDNADSTALTGTTNIDTSGITGKVSREPAVAAKQKAVIAQMKSVEGKLKYSQTNRNPEKGSGDCSSTVQWAYKKATGIDIGSYTGAQITNKNTVQIDKPNGSKFTENNMQLGDILLYGNSNGGHVELYCGNGQSIGHGSGYGPRVKNMNYRSDTYMHKRLKAFMPGMAGKGSGLFVSQKDSKWSGRKLGDETVASAGCAPAVATMAINNDKKYNMVKAIKDATQYKQDNNGGVSAEYFIDTFKKQGYDTAILRNKDSIIRTLKSGKNVVLIGQDINNTSKKKSPFGSESHYVLATGISPDGKQIYINDPELKSGDTMYNTDLLFRGMQLGIVPISNSNVSSSITEAARNLLGSFDGRGDKAGAASSAISVPDTSTTTSTSSTTVPEINANGNFLDELMKQFEMLAEGWGIASASSDEESSSGTTTVDNVDSTTKVSGSNNKTIIWNYLRDKGIPPYGIAGMMGNLKAESDLQFNNLEKLCENRIGYNDTNYTNAIDTGKLTRAQFLNPVPGKRYGYGLAQWTTEGRKGKLYDLVKQRNVSIADPQAQMDHLWNELNTNYKKTLNAMQTGSSIRAVSDVVLKDFERPADKGSAVQQKRANYGQTIYNELAGKGSGLSSISIPKSAETTIRSINRANSGKDIPMTTGSIYGKGTVTNTPDSKSKVSVPTVPYVSSTVKSITPNTNNKAVDTTNTLLTAIINLLTQEVKNTAFIEGIANAVVSLVDSKVDSTTDVSTKKQLLDTKGQILTLIRQQNNESSSTSLNDLIKSMETIIAQ